MKNTARIAAFSCLFAAAALVGCAGPQPPKVPHVKVEELSHVVAFHDNSTQLYPAERDSLAAFTSQIPAGSVTNVGLMADDTNLRAVERARSVRDFLVSRGFDGKAIRLQPALGIDPLTVVTKVSYAKGVPPELCPDWSKNSIADYEGTDASNFGCAYYTDFISQLADPQDYNGGRGPAPVFDAARDSVAMQRYMAGSSGSATSGSSSSSSSGGSTTTTTSTP